MGRHNAGQTVLFFFLQCHPCVGSPSRRRRTFSKLLGDPLTLGRTKLPLSSNYLWSTSSTSAQAITNLQRRGDSQSIFPDRCQALPLSVIQCNPKVRTQIHGYTYGGSIAMNASRWWTSSAQCWS